MMRMREVSAISKLHLLLYLSKNSHLPFQIHKVSPSLVVPICHHHFLLLRRNQTLSKTIEPL
jgi:hypothetical protein